MFNLFQRFKTKDKPGVQFDPILVIDDNEVDRTLVQRILERDHYTVLAAAGGEAGIKLAREHKIDLIVLDYHMPGINGVQVCEILKNDSRTKNIPIIFLTLTDIGGDIINFYEVGAEAYLHKPIAPKILLSEVKFILEEFKEKQ